MTGPNRWLPISPLLPRTWTKIGQPIEVPDGYVFVVSVSLKGQTIYPVNHYRTTEGNFGPAVDGHEHAIIGYTNSMARRLAAAYADRINSRGR